MKSIGGYMFFFGVGSIVLDYMDRQFTLLSWIDNWGSTVGWGIRIALIVVGAVLWFIGGKQEGSAT
jgi:hypothetical protein